MQCSRVVLIILAALFWTPRSLAAPYYVVQAGANHGLVAAGFGDNYSLGNWATTIGFTPSGDGDLIVTQLNARTGLTVFTGNTYQILVGAALLINSSHRTFFTLPSKYPANYYPPNAYYAAIDFMIEIKNGFFVEANILDYYFEVLAKNPNRSIRLSELLSLGVGFIF